MEDLKEKVADLRAIYCNYQEKNGFTFALSETTANKWLQEGLAVFKAEVTFEEFTPAIPQELLPYMEIMKAQIKRELENEVSRKASQAKKVRNRRIDIDSPQYKAWMEEAWDALELFEQTGEKFTVHDVYEIVSAPAGWGFGRSITNQKEFKKRFQNSGERVHTPIGNLTLYMSREGDQ